MKTLKYLSIVLAGLFIFIACQKEVSLEAGVNGNNAVGTFKDTGGLCPSIDIYGQYIKDSTLDGNSSYITVPVNVLAPGLYNVSTQQANGFFFADSGFFINTGIQNITLRAVGNPQTSIATAFQITFNGVTECSFTIDVTDSAVFKAAYTMKDTTGMCSDDSAMGIYRVGVPLNLTNKVAVTVNVQTTGKYSIEAGPTGGMTFEAQGIFVTTGPQVVLLQGAGLPTAPGPNTFSLAGDTTSCDFTINVLDTIGVPPPPTGDYFPTTSNSNWTYTETTTSDTDRVTVLGPDKVIGSNTYRQFLSDNQTSGIDTFFYRKGGGSYYQYSNMDPFGIYDTVIGQTEFIFLKDNAAVNATWDSPELDATLAGMPGKSKITFTIINNNLTITVGSQSVDSVIHVRQEYKFLGPPPAPYTTLGSIDYYYAKDIGFVKAESASPIPFTIYATRWEIF